MSDLDRRGFLGLLAAAPFATAAAPLAFHGVPIKWDHPVAMQEIVEHDSWLDEREDLPLHIKMSADNGEGEPW